jgi:hypothetical protein
VWGGGGGGGGVGVRDGSSGGGAPHTQHTQLHSSRRAPSQTASVDRQVGPRGGVVDVLVLRTDGNEMTGRRRRGFYYGR